MISRLPQKFSIGYSDASLVTIMCLPPKDPQDDDDENGEDEEDDEDDGERKRRARGHQRTGRMLIRAASVCPRSPSPS